jgi:phosphoglycolate phosphatase
MANHYELANQFSLIFDLDGTLVDSAPDLQAAVNTVLVSHGLRCISIEETHAFIGDGMPRLCERAIEATGGAPDLDGAFHEAFREHYASEPVVKTQVMSAVRETLITAKGAGFVMGVCTNKSERVAEIILNELQLMSFFTDCVGFRPGRELKPDPEPLLLCSERIGTKDRRAVLIGDSIADVKSARNANMLSIIVRGGYTNIAPDLLGADAVIDSFDDLFIALEELAT